jgi:hypothetical protein
MEDGPRRASRFLGLVAAVWLAMVPAQARAQCGARLSQCRSCHEVRGAKPVQPSPWHQDHAFADLCAACHGGDPQARDEATAHAGLASPLGDVQGTCGPCHGAASRTLALAYVTTLRPAPVPAPAAPPSRGRGIAWANLVLSTIVLAVGGAGATHVVRNERRLRSRSGGTRT